MLNEGTETYVVIVPYKHGLGFNSIIMHPSTLAIHIDVLKKYNHEFMFNTNSVDYIELGKKIDSERSKQETLWEYFDAEGWDTHYCFLESQSGAMN